MEKGTQEVELATRAVTKSIFLSSGKIFIFQCIGLLLGFGLQVFISHAGGPSALGGFTLFVSWLGILSVLTVPGLEGTLVFFLPRYEDDAYSRRLVVRNALLVVGGLSLLTAVALLAGGGRIFIWVGLPLKARVPFVLSLIVFSFGKLLDSVFLGMRDAPAISYFNVIRTVIRLVFCLPLLFFPGASWTILFYAVTIEGVLTLLLRYCRIQKRYPELLCSSPGTMREAENPLLNAEVIAITLPMFGISLVDNLYPFMDKAVLGAMLPLELLGVYRVSESIAALNSLFVAPFVSFWPYISKLYTEQRLDELRDAYRNINLVIIVIMIPFVLALLEFSGGILSAFGPIYARDGQTIFFILSFGYIVDAVAGPAGSVLKMTKHSNLSFCINMVLLFLYLWLSFVLARKYGLAGAAIAKTVVMVLANVANVTANHLLIAIFPYTWKHAWLLLAGVSIFSVRCLIPQFGFNLQFHLLMAFGEVALYACIAAAVMWSEIKQIRESLGNIMSARNTSRSE